MYETQTLKLAQKIKIDQDLITGTLVESQIKKNIIQDKLDKEQAYLRDVEKSLSKEKQQEKVSKYMKSITKDEVVLHFYITF